MKILLVSHSQKSGGAEKCLYEAAVGLREKGHDITVLIPSLGEMNTVFENSGFNVIINTFPWWVHIDRLNFFKFLKKIVGFIWYTSKMWSVIKHVKPDVVLSNTLCAPCAAIASKASGHKHFWFIHEYGKEDHGLIFDLGFYISSKIISYTAVHIFVNSQAIERKFSQFIREKKISVVNYDIPTPVSTTRLKEHNPGDAVNLLLVGQINKNKGQMDAIQALDILRQYGHQCFLTIVGQVSDESYFNTLKKIVIEKKLEHYVKFISHVEFPFDCVQGFVIGLMCSEFEALGRVTIEYMKLGIPVVGATSSTTAFLIKNKFNGLLYDLRNPAHLSQQIEYLINNPLMVESIRANAMAYASETFNRQTFIGGLLAHLDTTVDDR